MIIASRKLNLITNHQIREVAINLFIPELRDFDWICKYEIDWPDDKRKSFAAGIDSAQALHLAMQKIGIDLYMSDYHRLRQIVWIEPGQGYGFPIPKNGREFLIGQDREFEG